MLSSVFLFFSFSGSEIMLILFVALILFGGDKFPEIAKGLGKGIREFKDMSDGVKREIHTQINNYDQEPKRTDTTQPLAENTPPQLEQPYDDSADFHHNHDISVPTHEEPVVAPPVSVANHEPAPVVETPTSTPVSPATKPDLTPPANTISHQSY